MKRHEVLAPLSRDHHGALILARLLQKNAPLYKDLPTNPIDKAAYALNMFNSTLQNHFIKEEVVLAQVKSYHTEIEKLSGEIIEEHRQLTAAFIGLSNAEDLVSAMDVLGAGLEKHIRKEERVLFPLIQEYCPEEILKEIVF